MGGHSLLQGIFPTLGIKPRSLVLQTVSCIADRFFTIWATREAWLLIEIHTSASSLPFLGLLPISLGTAEMKGGKVTVWISAKLNVPNGASEVNGWESHFWTPWSKVMQHWVESFSAEGCPLLWGFWKVNVSSIVLNLPGRFRGAWERSGSWNYTKSQCKAANQSQSHWSWPAYIWQTKLQCSREKEKDSPAMRMSVACWNGRGWGHMSRGKMVELEFKGNEESQLEGHSSLEDTPRGTEVSLSAMPLDPSSVLTSLTVGERTLASFGKEKDNFLKSQGLLSLWWQSPSWRIVFPYRNVTGPNLEGPYPPGFLCPNLEGPYPPGFLCWIKCKGLKKARATCWPWNR